MINVRLMIKIVSLCVTINDTIYIIKRTFIINSRNSWK